MGRPTGEVGRGFDFAQGRAGGGCIAVLGNAWWAFLALGGAAALVDAGWWWVIVPAVATGVIAGEAGWRWARVGRPGEGAGGAGSREDAALGWFGSDLMDRMTFIEWAFRAWWLMALVIGVGIGAARGTSPSFGRGSEPSWLHPVPAAILVAAGVGGLVLSVRRGRGARTPGA
ncbi:MAG: hypothetical protein HY825_20215 [Acidobacteria bacterium]|nr:hypothetical protein [Acidobacteriota bacterium]